MTNVHKNPLNLRLSPQQRLRWQSPLPAPVMVLDIPGTVSEQWQQQLQTLIAHHECLRISLQHPPGLKVPLQCICHADTVVIDTTPWQSAEPVNADHQHEPVIRASLVRVDQHMQQLHLSVPPLAADRGTLLRLASALTLAGAQAHHETTPYSHYTAWLFELQHDEDAELARRYWQHQCPQHWQSKGLVYQHYHSDNATLAHTGQLASPELVDVLQAFCTAHDVSSETVLITAWAILLRRLAQDSDQDNSATPLGWVHDCRNDYEELANTWGLFSKTLPLPWKAVDDEDFYSAVMRMHHYQEETVEWQEYCAIDTELNPQHCRFGFEWSTIPVLTTATGATVSIANLQAYTQWFELLLVPQQQAQGKLRLQLHYDTRCYDTQCATVLLEQYQSLLMDALNRPQQPLDCLSIYSQSFANTLASLTVSSPWPCLDSNDLYPALFTQAAREYSNRLALVSHGNNDGNNVPLCYKDLDTRSNQLAHYLCARGIKAESRVALYLERSGDMVMAMLAVLKSGGAFVPVEIHQPNARTLTLLEQARPDLLIYTDEHSPPALTGVPTLALHSTSLQEYATHSPDVTISSEQAAYVLFTSGSTGIPKGVVIAHRQLQNYVTSLLSRVPLNAGEKSAIVTSLAADLSYTLLFTTLLRGAELHIIDRKTTLDPRTWAQYQQQHAIDHLKIVPSLLEAWLTYDDQAGVLPRRQLIMGGEPCKPALLNTLRNLAPDLQLYNHYGPTETTIGVMMHKVDKTLPANGSATQGLPLTERLDHTQIYILDANLNPVAPGQVGQLYIAGANLARGYLSAQQTAERFIHCAQQADTRLYCSGDLARYRPDGSIELQGRADRQVKIRGYRIELDEIETLLDSLPAVRQAAVVAVPRQQGEWQLFAFVTLKTHPQSSIAQLQGQLQDRLPDYMIPAVRLLENLPLLSSGKLDRQSLSQQALTLLKQHGTKPARTALEKKLAAHWAQALGLEKVGIEDDFFALGGHSLLAIKLASRLQSELNIPLKVNMIFAAPTVQQFAQLVQGEKTLSALVPLSAEQNNDKPMLFCFHPSTGHLRDYQHLPELVPHWQCWGLQAPFLIDAQQPLADSLDALARQYCSRLRAQQATGPYHLLGWSLGGLIAITVAALLEQAGETVAFLGVVDSQTACDKTPESIEQILAWAEDELDPGSRQRLRELCLEQHEALGAQLSDIAPCDWPIAIARWAQHHGLHLHNDNWQHMEQRQQRYRHTQQLIRSFNPLPLHCPITAWWATDTLNQLNNGTQCNNAMLPVNWQALTTGPVSVNVIAGHHMTILQTPQWQQQLNTILQQLELSANEQHRRTQVDSLSITSNEVI